MKKIITLTVLAATSSLVSAQTVTTTQTQSFGTSTLDFTDTLNFTQFNGNVADIVSVEWCYSLSVSGGQLVVDNDGSQAANVNASFGGDLDLTSTGLTLLDGTFNPIFGNVSAGTSSVLSLAANVGDGNNDYDSTGPDGAVIAGQNSTSTGSGFVNTAFHSQYVGAGGITLDLDADAFIDVGGIGGIEFASTPATANGFVTLKITTAVPEPSTALLGVLGAMGFVTRRKR